MESAVLDACVLFRNGVRDFLLWIAEAGAFSPAWSNTIHDEWMRNRREKLGDPVDILVRARSAMETAFPGANFEPDPATLQGISLPDMGDVLVVATAIAAQASTIVTYNVSHFPKKILAPLGLRRETPDAFCACLFVELETEVTEGARLHRASMKRPAYGPDEYLAHLAAKLELKRTAQLLRKVKNVI
jgi:hypothetical protein